MRFVTFVTCQGSARHLLAFEHVSREYFLMCVTRVRLLGRTVCASTLLLMPALTW